MELDELRESLAKLNPRQRQEKWLQSNSLWQPMMDATSWMPEYTISNVRISWILNSNGCVDYCEVCGNPCSWLIRPPHFSRWCSVACRNKDAGIREDIGKKNRANADTRTKKMVETKVERYGVNGSLIGTDITNSKKHVATMIERYGEDWAKKWYRQCVEEHDGIHPGNLHSHKTSKQEQEIKDSLVTLGLDCEIQIGNRSVLAGKELDIWIPEKHVAIEHCGEVWHSTLMRPKSDDRYHIHQKMLDCQSLGITLYTIFGEEWQDRRPQIQNLLESKLIEPKVKLFARKCSVGSIDHDVSRKFIEANHIQGCKKSPQYSFGLFDDSKLLVAVMAFDSHPRNISKMTLSRFCCLPGYQIVGGASKLFKHAVDEERWNDIISWSDNRWSSGNLYEKIGFVKVEELPPDYRYFSSNGIFSKQSCTKKDLIKRHPELNVNDTEEEMARQVGLFRFYDCGKIRWEWHRC